MADALIELKDVVRTYRMGEGEFHALRGVDLRVDPGEFVAIVGPSGSGKSTLMYLLGCLDTPTSGQYMLGDADVATLSDRKLSNVRNREIGFVFQHYNLLTDLNVIENIALGLAYAGSARSKRRSVAKSFAERFGLENHMRHRSSELSGGQMQRVAIGRALASSPRLILADEPTGNLDSVTGREIMHLLKQLHRAGHTLILVTHDQSVAEQAERIVRIVDGRIVSDERNAGYVPASEEGEPIPECPRGRGVSLFDSLRMAVREGLLAKKGRTVLTMLGIIFGIGAVIAMNGITEGGKQKQLQQIRQIGLNNVQVHDPGFEGARLLRERRANPYGLNATDIRTIREYLPELDALTAWKTIRADLQNGVHQIPDRTIFGVYGDFQHVTNFHVGKGRFLNEQDEERYHRVCVLGDAVAEQLNLGPDPLNSWIVIGDEHFRVVGIMGHRDFTQSDVRDLQIRDRNQDIYIPYASLRTYYKKDAYDSQFDIISLRLSSEDALLPQSQYLHRMLRKLHHDAEDFEISVPLEKLKQAQETKEVFNVIIVIIAAISLLVGGIGIMNIMLANVTERTREIGIRRAVGASRSDVLNQFVIEALLISLLGGCFGLGLGLLGGAIIEAIFAFPVAFNPLIMAVAIMVSVLVGLVFGIYPAWLAARMDPVEALRS
ncbi:MAG: macrolide transport system ATP-binding/permease protein [Rhodothermales bacterium]|jgi:macrolide transport system ATP-binding/permease protein